MARLTRVVLVAARTDDYLDPITLDVFLDESKQVMQNFPTSGWWGKLKNTEDLMPFIFFPNGKMDFGTEFEIEDRYARTNLQNKRIEINEYVTVDDSDGQHCFRVKEIHWLGDRALLGAS